jgi:diacylglycerol kinase
MGFKKFIKATHHALNGVKYAVKTQTNFRFFFLIMLGVAAINIALDFEFYDWLVCIGLSLFIAVVEMINTGIEALCDLYSTEFNPKIKIIKDVAAGSVFVTIAGVLLIYFGLVFEKIF